ncbi:MAG: metallophosphoesterase [Sphingomonadaceae bacterium]|nr:metallophosphoesterase [Sphingomonadaceae bacterium]
MLIAQITDLHLGATNGDPRESNESRLDRVLARLTSMRPRPDLLLLTGDLTENGSSSAYAALAERLAALDFPALLAVGNHDRRAAFRTHFPHVPVDGDFIHYVHDAGPLRIVVLDSLEEGRHGGSFCDRRAAWLKRRLDEAPDRPTIIVLHHPPIESGIGWMTIAPHAPWVTRLDEVLAGRSNVVAMLSGHLHRPMVSSWGGTIIAACPSTAPPLALELAPIDPAHPDGRPLVTADPPAYALHLWTGTRLLTHFETLGEHVPVARFDAQMQPVIDWLVNQPAGD